MAVRKKPPEGPEGQDTKVTPKASSKASEDSAKNAAAARAAVLKVTGKKIVGEDRGSRPFVSSGSFLLDHLIGGTMAEDGKSPICPGYPRRCYTELFGAEASGKTTAALEAVAEVQRQGGLAMFLDFEKALSQKYARSIGVSFDPDKLLLFQPDTMEEGWKMILIGLQAKVDLIVADSVAAMVPKEELEKGFDDPARIGAQARALSQVLPKIATWLNDPNVSKNPKGTALVFINQNRAVISTTAKASGDHNTAGGKAFKYFAHLRIQFTKIRSEVKEVTDRHTGKKKRSPFGQHTQAKIIKTRLDSTAGHTTDLFIRYGQGIDNYYSLIESGVANRIIKKSGSTLSYGEHEERSKEKFRDYLCKNHGIFEEIKRKVLVAVKDDEPVDDISDEESMISTVEDALGGNDLSDDSVSDTPVVEEVIESDSDDSQDDEAAE